MFLMRKIRLLFVKAEEKQGNFRVLAENYRKSVDQRRLKECKQQYPARTGDYSIWKLDAGVITSEPDLLFETYHGDGEI